MTRLLCLCGGFLLAVLWFDLMFDVQVLGAPPGTLPEEVLASISAHYARVTTAADPMPRLIALVMVITVLGTAVQWARGWIPRRLAAFAFVTCTAPIVLALVRIVPNAIRLGGRGDPVVVQSALARSICYEHIACFVSILVFCGLQLLAGARREQREVN
jgi:hypothetical protein